MTTGSSDKGGDGHVALACATRFDRLPPELVVSAFGVDYGHVRPPEGGDLYVTRYGWPVLRHLLPENWYANRWYVEKGKALPGTGNVYHVPTRSVDGKSVDLVVKFSRVAQDVPLEVATTFPDDIPPEIITNARFNSPMEEFALVMELRRGAYGPRHLRVLTQRPLAIYAAPEEFELWELGRCQTRFHAHWRRLAADQGDAIKAIEFDIKRIYVLLYGWIKGEDATQALEAGYIDREEFLRLTPRVVQELRSKGYRVLDNKPSHFILRRRRLDSRVLRGQDGQITYGLVDFELLQRTPEYQSRFKAEQRKRYWLLQSRRFETPRVQLPSHLRQMTVFGVDYVFGTTPDGGRLWVVGRNPELFDYFLPGRWRRTSRLKLNPVNEVYSTRTRDNIYLVYRRSRVGEQPHADPLFEQGRRMREHGHNSPFEEVAIAEWLRQCGVSTTFPRAIYRTGHPTTRIVHGRDDRRFESHAELLTPGPVSEAVLLRDYDYYTIWGYFRGIEAEVRDERRSGRVGIFDLEGACDAGMLDSAQYEEALSEVRARLSAAGVEPARIEEHEFVVFVEPDGTLRRDDRGRVDGRLCIDALTAYEHNFLSERDYRALMGRVEAQLATVACEKLDLRGDHLLLSMDPDGVLDTDGAGEIHVVLCNFEFIRGPLVSVGRPCAIEVHP